MRPSYLHALFVALFMVLGTTLASAASLTLAWDPPVDGLTTGYVVVYGTAPGVYTSRVDVGLVNTRRIDGLLDGTRYYFRVQAYTITGALSDFSSEVSGATSGSGSGGGGGVAGGGGSTGGGSATGGIAVGAATGGGPSTSVVGFMRDGRYVDINWAPLEGVHEYRVEVGNSPAATVFSAVTSNSAITFDSADLPSAQYYIRVRGLFGGIPGSISNEETVAGSAFPRADVSTAAAGSSCGDLPGAPRQFFASASGPAVQLTWQPGSGSPAASYVLQVGSAPGLQNLMIVALPGAQSNLQANAANGIYALRMSATNGCGTSVWGAETILNVGGVAASSSATAVTLGAPIGLAQTVSGTLVTLTWTPPAGGAVTRYFIEATIADGTVVAALDTGHAGTTFTHDNTPAGQYFVTVRAGNAGGFGPPSAPVTVVVP